MQKSNTKKIYLFSCVLVAVAGAIGWRMFVTWQQRQDVQHEIEALEREVEEHKQANERLEDSIKELGSLSAKERTAREELDLKRQGEVVLRFAGNPPPPLQKEIDPMENRKKWLDYLFGK